MKTKFYVCPVCGNVITKIIDSSVVPECCGQPMQELVPNTVDAAAEKHLPVVTRVDDCTLKVQVGSVPHPMTPEHHICFVYLETTHGGQLHYLDSTCGPDVEFCGCKDKPVAVYAYCNLHGLWKTEAVPDKAAGKCCCRAK